MIFKLMGAVSFGLANLERIRSQTKVRMWRSFWRLVDRKYIHDFQLDGHCLLWVVKPWEAKKLPATVNGSTPKAPARRVTDRHALWMNCIVWCICKTLWKHGDVYLTNSIRKKTCLKKAVASKPTAKAGVGKKRKRPYWQAAWMLDEESECFWRQCRGR